MRVDRHISRILAIFFTFLSLEGYFITYAECRWRRSAGSEWEHHEVVFPRLYHGNRRLQHTRTQDGHVGELTLHLPTAHRHLTVHLRRNTYLLSPNYVERYITAKGETRVAPSNQSTSDCYYHGSVVGEDAYSAALSTCHGISGRLSAGGEVYHIEPRDGGVAGRHRVYKDSHRKHANLTCGHSVPHVIHNDLRQDLHERLKREVRWPYDTDRNTKLVELYLVNDRAEYLAMDRDITAIVQRNKEIVNIVSSLYRPLGIYVSLVGVEVWRERDPIDVEANADKTMNSFLSYRRQEISPVVKNDNAQLITGRQFSEGVVGKAPISTLCTWQYSGGVNMDHSDAAGPTATTIAHELGHNFGLVHDLDSCECPDKRCIMAASSSGKNPTAWSSCSMEQFDDAFYQGMDLCLHDLPAELYGTPLCGNGFLEDGEECDCGLPEDCDNPCCDATTCRLTANATCATGKCCDRSTCTVRPMAYPCRPAAGQCDLPEACNGESQWCPHDIHRRDGSACDAEGKPSHCWEGACPSREIQCQKLWGSSGRNAHPLCYSHFNVMGVASGHCGFDWLQRTFNACSTEDAVCGMLHCEHENEKLMLWKETLAYTLPEAWVVERGERHDCKAAILDVGLAQRDPGLVPQGTPCGDGKMCVNQKCTLVEQVFGSDCPDCNGHGTCNSLGQCHCEHGYAPPHCDRRGAGGSAHSGPMGPHPSSRALITGLLVFFLVILPILAGVIWGSYKNRRQLKELWAANRPSNYSIKFRRSISRAHPPQHDSRPAVNNTVAKPVAKPVPKPVNKVKKQPSVTRQDIGAIHFNDSTNPRIHNIPELPANHRSKTLQDARANNTNAGHATVAHTASAPSQPPRPPVSAGPSTHSSTAANHMPVSPTRSAPPKPAPPSVMNTSNNPQTESSSHIRPHRPAPQPPSYQEAIKHYPPTHLPNPPTHSSTDAADMLSSTYEDVNTDHHYSNQPPPRPPPPLFDRKGINKAPASDPRSSVGRSQSVKPAVPNKPTVARSKSAVKPPLAPKPKPSGGYNIGDGGGNNEANC